MQESPCARESVCERVLIGLETSHEKVRESDNERVWKSDSLTLGLSDRSVLSNQELSASLTDLSYPINN